MSNPNYNLFSVLGIEIEYMLVDKESLDIRPMADYLIKEAGGDLSGEVLLGDIGLSNEFVMHLIELKNNGPKALDTDFAGQFFKALKTLEPFLAAKNLMFLPSAAHPWMNPLTETKRWPYNNNTIYQQYDKIFNCNGHGWSNLQSMHINLPFANDHEFFQLHSAMRLLIPLIPALAASSPFIEGKKTGFLDTRLHFYQKNQEKIPAIIGEVVPEFIKSPTEYQDKILKPMYEAIKPYDKEGLLQEEWLNSRACIPKFSVQAIEIRITDTQECVNADIAIASAIVEILKYWINQTDYFLHHPCSTKTLKKVFDKTIQSGFDVEISDKDLARQWLLPKTTFRCRDFWSYWIEVICTNLSQKSQKILEFILSQGSLSERLLKAHPHTLTPSALRGSYQKLADCLSTNRLFGEKR